MTSTLWLLLALIAALLATGASYFIGLWLAKRAKDAAANWRKVSRHQHRPNPCDELALRRDLHALQRQASGCTSNCEQGRHCTCALAQPGKKP